MLYKVFAFLLPLACTVLMATAQNGVAPQNKTDFTAIGSPMPPFMAVTLTPLKTITNNSGTTKVVTDKMVKNNANLFVMIFNPICEHCEEQTALLEKNLNLFKNSKIVLICGKTYRQYLNNFLLITHNKDYPAIEVGVDSTDFIKQTLLYDQLPQLNIYSRDRKLLKTFSGSTPIDSFKRYIE